MDEKGGLPGGVVSEVKNLHSAQICVISTAPEIGEDYWSTTILPTVVQRRLFGLRRKTLLDLNHPVASFIRNTKQSAYEVHALVRHIVSTEAANKWFGSFPEAAPAEGYSEGAQRKLRDVLGDEAV